MKTHTCAYCSSQFDRYSMNRIRAAKPQYCRPQCFSAALADRAQQAASTRLLSRVANKSDSECWEWTGRRTVHGYGVLDMRERGGKRARPRLAHRLIYEHFIGPLAADLVVCHRCDNPPCCNPAHLFIGTQADNVRDMIEKGRKASLKPRRGSEANFSKLTEAQVREILQSKETLRALGQRYGVSSTAIQYIRSGRNWGHISGERHA